MSLYVLDTDHYSLFQHGQAKVAVRVKNLPAEYLAVTIITAEEQLTGWYTQVRKAKTADQLARAYEGLFEILDSLKRIRVLPFTLAAVQRCQGLRKSIRRISIHDLAIAAITMELNGTLVTRNRSDFQQVPGLVLEDWSKP